MELSDFLAMDELKELKVKAAEHLGINLHKNATMKTVVQAIEAHYTKKPVVEPAGWVTVEGITDAYVGTGLGGAENKLFLGQTMKLPVLLANELIKNNKVKEI